MDRYRKGCIALITTLILVGAPALGLACDKDKQTAQVAAAEAKPCCAAMAAECAGKSPEECHAAMIQKAVRLAGAAEGGCEQSMGQLIALAKGSGHEEAVTLAASAEAGSAESKAALIALAKSMGQAMAPSATESASMAQLADWAGHGCEKSAATLIARAKASGDAELATLAAKAEGGSEDSKQALIAKVTQQQSGTTLANGH